MGTWAEDGCGCDICPDCIRHDTTMCLCDCGIPRNLDYPDGCVPAHLRMPLVFINNDDPSLNEVIPSKIGTVTEKHIVANQVDWAPCKREDCACTASYNGKPGEYCCNTCRNGTPCMENNHSCPPPNKCRLCSEYVWDIMNHLQAKHNRRGKGGRGKKGRNGRR